MHEYHTLPELVCTLGIPTWEFLLVLYGEVELLVEIYGLGKLENLAEGHSAVNAILDSGEAARTA